jgi:hypothetical protein
VSQDIQVLCRDRLGGLIHEYAQVALGDSILGQGQPDHGGRGGPGQYNEDHHGLHQPSGGAGRRRLEHRAAPHDCPRVAGCGIV